MMHPFCQHVADLARAELTASNPGAPEEARCLLATFGAISMRYQDVRPPPQAYPCPPLRAPFQVQSVCCCGSAGNLVALPAPLCAAIRVLPSRSSHAALAAALHPQAVCA